MKRGGTFDRFLGFGRLRKEACGLDLEVARRLFLFAVLLLLRLYAVVF